MNDSLSLKTVMLMLTSFLISIMSWDIFLKDFYMGAIGENPSIFDITFGYTIPVVIFIVFFLFLSNRFKHEDESASEY